MSLVVITEIRECPDDASTLGCTLLNKNRRADVLMRLARGGLVLLYWNGGDPLAAVAIRCFSYLVQVSRA